MVLLSMEEILSRYRQDFDEIRKLCLICHGLDLSTSSFSLDSSDWKISEPTGRVLQNIISSNILQLAIALRTNFYQKNILHTEEPLNNSAWLYYDKELMDRPATLKQVCDKIIHADTFSKPVCPKGMSDHENKICTQLRGTEFKKSWTLDIALDLFAKDILKILDRIEMETSRHFSEMKQVVE